MANVSLQCMFMQMFIYKMKYNYYLKPVQRDISLQFPMQIKLISDLKPRQQTNPLDFVCHLFWST